MQSVAVRRSLEAIAARDTHLCQRTPQTPAVHGFADDTEALGDAILRRPRRRMRHAVLVRPWCRSRRYDFPMQVRQPITVTRSTPIPFGDRDICIPIGSQ